MRLDGRDTDGLVPMADMLNHKRPNETDWDYSDAKGCFTITTVKDMRKGEQVFDSYGRKCNSRFFVNYGFSLVENEDNQIAIKVCVPVDVEMYADKIRLLGTTTKSAQIPRQYSFKGTKDILSLLRIAFASEQQMKAWRGEGRRGYLHVNTRDVPPISLQNECRALTSLAQTCTAYLARFDTTLAEDEKLLSGLEPEAEKALTRNQRNAVLMRRGEKQVCHHYIQLARDTLKLCDLAPQDVKRQVEVENLLFQSAFAREYYVLAVEPLLGIK